MGKLKIMEKKQVYVPVEACKFGLGFGLNVLAPFSLYSLVDNFLDGGDLFSGVPTQGGNYNSFDGTVNGAVDDFGNGGSLFDSGSGGSGSSGGGFNSSGVGGAVDDFGNGGSL